MEIHHEPVLLDEVRRCLVPPRPDALMLDCTLGEGGHAQAFLSAYPSLRYVGFDADPRIQAKARERLAPFAPRVSFFLGWFDELLALWSASGLPGGPAEPPDLVLFDLGISMHHYLESGRGFGFGRDEPLDMRLSPEGGRGAAELVNGEREEELARIIFEYGEERYSRRIAAAIVEARRSGRIATSGRLAEIVAAASPAPYRHGRIHPATRTFQALRIAVNDELGRAERAIRTAAAILAPGGTLAVISFHSLEDRIAKTVLRGLAGKGPEAAEPANMPPVLRGAGEAVRAPAFELVHKKALEASPAEAARNPASRSAKLRAIRRLPRAAEGIAS